MRTMIRIALALALAALLLSGRRLSVGYGGVLYANWGLALPGSRWETVYAADSGPSYFGDGLRYHVFTAADDNAALPGEDEFGGVPEHVSDWLDQLDIPERRRPGSDAVLRFHARQSDGSEIWLFRSADGKMLYAAESFL